MIGNRARSLSTRRRARKARSGSGAMIDQVALLLLGQPLADVAHWLKLLAGADAVYVTIGLLTFEFVLEG